MYWMYLCGSLVSEKSSGPFSWQKAKKKWYEFIKRSLPLTFFIKNWLCGHGNVISYLICLRQIKFCKISLTNNEFESFEDGQTGAFCSCLWLCHMKVIDRNIPSENNTATNKCNNICYQWTNNNITLTKNKYHIFW